MLGHDSKSESLRICHELVPLHGMDTSSPSNRGMHEAINVYQHLLIEIGLDDWHLGTSGVADFVPLLSHSNTAHDARHWRYHQQKTLTPPNTSGQ